MPIDLFLPTPTPAEVKASRLATGLSQEAAAAVVGLTGRQAWYRFEAESATGRPIDPVVWAMWLLSVGQHPGYVAMPVRARREPD